MLRIIFGIFFILHGIVHLLYFGQSVRFFELRPGLVWPDEAWAFSRLLGNETTRTLAGILLVIAAFGFILGGIGLFAKQPWWRPATLSVAVFSTVLYLLLWDGAFQHLPDKGAVSILINLAIIVIVLAFGSSILPN